LRESPQHMAVLGGAEAPKPPLQIQQTLMVGRQAYYFVNLAPAG